MRRSVGVLLPGLVAALAGACFDFEATMAGGPLTDAGADADASVSDDSAVPGDAVAPGDEDAPGTSADAPAAEVDAGAPDGSFCASIRPDGGIFFCDDFDEHALPGSWNSWGETSGTITESDASAASPPNSVDEKTMAISGTGQTIDVSLRTPLGLPPLPATLRFGFSLEPVQIDPTANATIVLGAIDFLDAKGNRYSTSLAIDVSSGAPALGFDEQSGFTDGGTVFVHHPLPPTQPLPLNAWSDLVMEVDWTAPGTAEGKVTVDGSQEIDVPLTMTVTPASLQIGIGTAYVNEPAPVWELRYDNVRFTAR